VLVQSAWRRFFPSNRKLARPLCFEPTLFFQTPALIFICMIGPLAIRCLCASKWNWVRFYSPPCVTATAGFIVLAIRHCRMRSNSPRSQLPRVVCSRRLRSRFLVQPQFLFFGLFSRVRAALFIVPPSHFVGDGSSRRRPCLGLCSFVCRMFPSETAVLRVLPIGTNSSGGYDADKILFSSSFLE